MYKYSIDFESDLRTALIDECKDYVPFVKHRDKLRDMLIEYLTVHFKLIPPIPREVKISPPYKR